ncbi:hypothetical protein SADUNF_Sadunf10G0076400 [Salix dunnii]|uniref:Uncharacterized protein n=1 Tax=Salix dunnii TaxID=1413687 RepID=A0A835JSR0_9ROSI|nr:hypothetical protein SADUNF_Sadunf10G0076400 [Salix dunnii]
MGDATQKMRGNGDAVELLSTQRLKPFENKEHNPESYEEMQLGCSPRIFSSVMRVNALAFAASPTSFILSLNWIVDLMSLISDANWQVQKRRKYRQHILSNYKPMMLEFMLALAPSNTERHSWFMIADIICILSKLKTAVKHFTVSTVIRYEQFGDVLDDFGLETILEKLMDGYTCPMSRGIVSLFVFYADDSKVTLNVCLGKQFHGEDLFFDGVWCNKQVNTETQPEVTRALCDMLPLGMVQELPFLGTRSTELYGAEAGVDIADGRKKKDNVCQLLLRTGMCFDEKIEEIAPTSIH